jgi:hypothetical protein
MPKIRQRFRYYLGQAVVLSAALCAVFTPAFAQNSSGQESTPKTGPVPIVGGFEKITPLPPGGPAPRMADGHPDLTGRWYPNAAGKMLQVAYPVNRAAFQQFDPKATPEEKPSFKPGVDSKYTRPNAYGVCDQPGTPSDMLEQISQHVPIELIETPQRLVVLFEYPLNVRMIYTGGRVHPKDPDPTFNGDSTARWEGDTLVVDVIAIDDRLRNLVPGLTQPGWFPSDQDHVIERWTRTSKNYLTYQVTIEDPVVLAKPWKSANRTWTLAQDPHDEWGEVFCTHNEEPDEIKKIDAAKARSN